MDGIQLQRLVQDENAGHLSASALGNNKPGLQAPSGGTGLKAGPLSARKAFGNITNKAGPAQQQDGPDGGATIKRRALGDLSVNRPAQQQFGSGGDGGKAGMMKAGPSRQPLGPQQAAPAAALPAADLAARYAASGVERFAGKTWRVLEEEREEEEEAAAAAAAQRLTASLSSWQLRARPLQVASDDDDEQLLAPQPSTRTAATSTAQPCSSGLSSVFEDGDDFFGGSHSSAAALLPDLPAELAATPATPTLSGALAEASPVQPAAGAARPWDSPDAQPW
ncbi:hypothetical protein Rsub_12768 [Raphidocelis subcapitata]|uniref:Uncharacterized protein n=1 Tax=Raphidocelis subcapitata TaxID=307507 RepID=A0A2V0PPT9_9CHLO|nr:hypothetical protein Rsub_12768 [Raphidocelis subcapitata]|eukprot:GBG00071.1 hypothetical protein Rsub_12768 [Raphidocelis subcapitata]